MRTPVILAAMLVVTACNYGVRPANFGPANSPQGMTVAVRVGGEASDRIGELFAVDSIGITINAQRLVRVAWKRIAAMDVEHMSNDFHILHGEQVTPAKRERLALISRFPQGISPALLTQILHALAQDARDEIT